MRKMADLLDDESILYSSDDLKPIEVLPEMLDYAFVDTCESINELRAVMNALKSRKWGSYPDLENHTRIKLIGLLPDRDKKRITAIAAMPSPSTVSSESENLHNWIDHIVIASSKSGASNSFKQMKHSAVPVRGMKHSDLRMVDVSMADNSADVRVKEKIISKPLSKVRIELASLPYDLSISQLRYDNICICSGALQEYFDRWNQFEALDSSDDESEAACKNESVIEQASQRRAAEQSQLQDRLLELSHAERNIMSIREREKGNEYFRVFDNDDALLCYTKSICLDESNEKSYANRAAVLIRQSNFDRAIENCTKALEINPLYVKALARRALCYHKMGRYKEAVIDFEACREMDDCADIVRLLQRSKEKLDKSQISGNNDGTSSGNDEVDEYEVIEEVFTPGALKAEKLPTRIISPVEGNGCTQSVLREDQTWNKMMIIEADNIGNDDDDDDDDDDEIVKTRTGMRRINIEEEFDGQDDLHAAEGKQKVRRHDSQALAF
jgi:tetratricopeptide (TPR) repeat protein